MGIAIKGLNQATVDDLTDKFVFISKARVKQIWTVGGFILASVLGLTWATAWTAGKAAVSNVAAQAADIQKFHDQAKNDLDDINKWRDEAGTGKFQELKANKLTLLGSGNNAFLTVVNESGETVVTMDSNRLQYEKKYKEGNESKSALAQFGVFDNDKAATPTVALRKGDKNYVKDQTSQ